MVRLGLAHCVKEHSLGPVRFSLTSLGLALLGLPCAKSLNGLNRISSRGTIWVTGSWAVDIKNWIAHEGDIMHCIGIYWTQGLWNAKLAIQKPVHWGNLYFVECRRRRLGIGKTGETADLHTWYTWDWKDGGKAVANQYWQRPRIGIRIPGEPYWEARELTESRKGYKCSLPQHKWNRWRRGRLSPGVFEYRCRTYNCKNKNNIP